MIQVLILFGEDEQCELMSKHALISLCLFVFLAGLPFKVDEQASK